MAVQSENWSHLEEVGAQKYEEIVQTYPIDVSKWLEGENAGYNLYTSNDSSWNHIIFMFWRYISKKCENTEKDRK